MCVQLLPHNAGSTVQFHNEGYTGINIQMHFETLGVFCTWHFLRTQTGLWNPCDLTPRIQQLASGWSACMCHPTCSSYRRQQPGWSSIYPSSPTHHGSFAPSTGYWWLLQSRCLPCCEWVRPYLKQHYSVGNDHVRAAQGPRTQSELLDSWYSRTVLLLDCTVFSHHHARYTSWQFSEHVSTLFSHPP